MLCKDLYNFRTVGRSIPMLCKDLQKFPYSWQEYSHALQRFIQFSYSWQEYSHDLQRFIQFSYSWQEHSHALQSFIEISWNKNIRPGVPSFFSPNFFNHLMISNYSFFNLSQSTYVTLAKCLIPKQKLLITILKIGDPNKKKSKDKY